MRVGLTYDLRKDYEGEGLDEEQLAEFDSPETIDALENAIRRMGHETDRIGNSARLISRLSGGDCWDMVFNIAEGLYGYSREALIPALLESRGIPCAFSDPMALSLALHKGMSKRIVRDLGLPTPDFAIVESVEDVRNIDLPYPLFAKPVAEGTSKGVTAASKIETKAGLEKVCAELLERFRQPVIVETYLPGREFTVGILGTGRKATAVAALEINLNDNAEKEIYTFVNKEECEERVTYTLAGDPLAIGAKNLALAVWRGMGLRDAGRVDVRVDAYGVPNFVEVNPLPGLHPFHSDLPIMCTHVGKTYQELIETIMTSALERTGARSLRPALAV
ncbi:MAG: D-alanine--D-alanine ligase [Nitrospinae bacterium]|nr:D-alanine--D-alanine ligase [Nitrospinota bacterium]